MTDFDDPRTEEYDLLKQAQAGDYTAFESLFDRLYPSVSRFVARLIGDSPDVDDIVQLTFIAFYRSLPRIDPPETMRAYLFKIARNRCTDALRRQGRYEVGSLADDESTPLRITFTSSAEPENPEDATHWLLVGLAVREAMNQLPEVQRQTLILYAEENLSLQEIALTMDTKVGTVKSRLYHARKNLRGLLHPQTLAAVNTLFEPQTNDMNEREEIKTNEPVS